MRVFHTKIRYETSTTATELDGFCNWYNFIK